MFFWSHVRLCRVNNTSMCCHPAMIPPSPRCIAAACGAGKCLRCSRPLRLSHSRMFAVQLCRGRVEVPVRVSKGSSHFVLDISPHTRPLCESFPQWLGLSERRQVLGLLLPLSLQPLLLHPSPVFRQRRNRVLQLHRLSNTKVSLCPSPSVFAQIHCQQPAQGLLHLWR